MTRERLSATVEGELLEAGRQAVAEGRAESVSVWVNDALRLKADHDRRMRALDEFIAVYEAEHGVISDDEIRQAKRRAGRAPSWLGAAHDDGSRHGGLCRSGEKRPRPDRADQGRATRGPSAPDSWRCRRSGLAGRSSATGVDRPASAGGRGSGPRRNLRQAGRRVACRGERNGRRRCGRRAPRRRRR